MIAQITSQLDLARIARVFSLIKVRLSLPYISCFTMASLESEPTANPLLVRWNVS